MKTLILLLLAFGFSACATPQTEYPTQVCHFRAAYILGVNDRIEGKTRDLTRFNDCSGLERERSLRAYHRGYERKVRQISQPNLSVESVALVQDRLYVCRASAFNDDYRQEGKSLLEARNKVVGECSERHAAVFCSKIDCETQF